jgi:hypothetical protein
MPRHSPWNYLVDNLSKTDGVKENFTLFKEFCRHREVKFFEEKLELKKDICLIDMSELRRNQFWTHRIGTYSS